MFTKIGSVIFLLALETAASSQDLKGIYSGVIESSIQPGNTIPLQVSLYPTNEFKTTSGARMQVIDSAFLIDDEGGPFGFSDVKFDPNTGFLELSYLRPQEGSEAQTPNFKLEGKIDAQGVFSGKVQAISSGFTGTFTIKKSNQTFLVVKTKYSGSWKGKLKQNDGKMIPFGISLANSIIQTQNPPAYDFEYSRGRLGSYSYEDATFPATQIYINYFKREISIASRTLEGGTSFVTTFKILDGGKKLKGLLGSSGSGLVGTVDLDRVGG